MLILKLRSFLFLVASIYEYCFIFNKVGSSCDVNKEIKFFKLFHCHKLPIHLKSVKLLKKIVVMPFFSFLPMCKIPELCFDSSWYFPYFSGKNMISSWNFVDYVAYLPEFQADCSKTLHLIRKPTSERFFLALFMFPVGISSCSLYKSHFDSKRKSMKVGESFSNST